MRLEIDRKGPGRAVFQEPLVTEKARLCRAFFMLFSLHFFLGLRLFFFVLHLLFFFLALRLLPGMGGGSPARRGAWGERGILPLERM